MLVRKFFPLSFFFLIISSFQTLAGDVSVMIYLDRKAQPDSLGYNIVAELPQIIYGKIISREIKLYDTPAKEVQIAPAMLQKIERTTGTSFSETNQLFIYQLWNKSKHDCEIKNIGFYFSNNKTGGEKVSYGFVEYSEAVQYLQANRVPANADGNYNTSFNDILEQNRFYFNIVQYDKKKIDSPQESMRLKSEEGCTAANIKTNYVSESKLITYSIQDSALTGDAGVQAKNFLAAMQQFLNDNKEIYYNIGGDKVSDFLKKENLKITKADVTELWLKNNGTISTDVSSVILFVNGKPLPPLTLSEMLNWELVISFRSMNDFLKEKNFFYRILQINKEEIDPLLSASFIKALKTYRWNALHEFVKYN